MQGKVPVDVEELFLVCKVDTKCCLSTSTALSVFVCFAFCARYTLKYCLSGLGTKYIVLIVVARLDRGKKVCGDRQKLH